MEQKLVLQDIEGQVVRAFQWSGRSVHVIRRADTQRLELVEDFNELEQKKIAYQKLGTLEPESIRQKPLLIGQLGELRFVENIERTIIDEENPEENKRIWRGVIFSLGLLFTGFIGILQSIPLTTPKMEEELIQEVVKIVK